MLKRRAGMGYSDPGPTSRTSGQIATELAAKTMQPSLPWAWVLVPNRSEAAAVVAEVLFGREGV